MTTAPTVELNPGEHELAENLARSVRWSWVIILLNLPLLVLMVKFDDLWLIIDPVLQRMAGTEDTDFEFTVMELTSCGVPFLAAGLAAVFAYRGSRRANVFNRRLGGGALLLACACLAVSGYFVLDCFLWDIW